MTQAQITKAITTEFRITKKEMSEILATTRKYYTDATYKQTHGFDMPQYDMQVVNKGIAIDNRIAMMF